MATKTAIISRAAGATLWLGAGVLGAQAATIGAESPAPAGATATVQTPQLPSAEGHAQSSSALPTAPAAPSFLAEQSEDHLKSDQLIGATVFGLDEQKIGDVSYLVFDADGRIAGVVVSVGGFLGIGDKQIAIPWEKVSVLRDREGQDFLWVPVSETQVEAAPSFKTLAELEAERQLAEEQLKLLQGEQ